MIQQGSVQDVQKRHFSNKIEKDILQNISKQTISIPEIARIIVIPISTSSTIYKINPSRRKGIRRPRLPYIIAYEAHCMTMLQPSIWASTLYDNVIIGLKMSKKILVIR